MNSKFLVKQFHSLPLNGWRFSQLKLGIPTIKGHRSVCLKPSRTPLLFCLFVLCGRHLLTPYVFLTVFFLDRRLHDGDPKIYFGFLIETFIPQFFKLCSRWTTTTAVVIFGKVEMSLNIFFVQGSYNAVFVISHRKLTLGDLRLSEMGVSGEHFLRTLAGERIVDIESKLGVTVLSSLRHFDLGHCSRAAVFFAREPPVLLQVLHGRLDRSESGSWVGFFSSLANRDI